ncbi:MAG: type II toxin-antitoxin system RelE/ParE family toxin [Alphaproteobacteria bacterium]|nr:type II toxin-antitoxin system RelE/ParE family toxin [Alphaproteobacteria bacterium]
MAKQYKVRLSPSAKPDLKGIAEWIIDQSGHVRAASSYVRRIRTYLTGFKNFPHRGT